MSNPPELAAPSTAERLLPTFTAAVRRLQQSRTRANADARAGSILHLVPDDAGILLQRWSQANHGSGGRIVLWSAAAGALPGWLLRWLLAGPGRVTLDGDAEAVARANTVLRAACRAGGVAADRIAETGAAAIHPWTHLVLSDADALRVAMSAQCGDRILDVDGLLPAISVGSLAAGGVHVARVFRHDAPLHAWLDARKQQGGLIGDPQWIIATQRPSAWAELSQLQPDALDSVAQRHNSEQHWWIGDRGWWTGIPVPNTWPQDRIAI